MRGTGLGVLLAADAEVVRDHDQLRAMHLTELQYCIIVLPGKVKLRKCEQEIDYSVEVERTFAKFKQGAVKSYLSKLSAAAGMNHIEAVILDRVAQLYPDLFLRLSQYNEKYKDFVDESIAVFNREIQFYVAFAPHVLPCFRLC